MLFLLTQVNTYHDKTISSILDFPYNKYKQNLLILFSNVSLKLENPKTFFSEVEYTPAWFFLRINCYKQHI